MKFSFYRKNQLGLLLILIDLTVQMGLYAGGALLFLGLLDYFYQKYDFEKNLRMSKQDIKDEYKNFRR